MRRRKERRIELRYNGQIKLNQKEYGEGRDGDKSTNVYVINGGDIPLNLTEITLVQDNRSPRKYANFDKASIL
jgi:hypothetical protein